MGWNPQTLTDLVATMDKAGLKLGPNTRLMDIGSQDVFAHAEASRKQLFELTERLGGSPGKLPDEPVFPARQFFEACGVEYWCVDIDERPRTLWVDLNTGKFPWRLRGTFDVVCNAGTTEHVANPVMALFAIHQLAKKGGVLFHDVPMNGFGNHSFLNYTPKFWHAMIWMNRYEVLLTRVRGVNENEVDINNFRPEYLMNYFEGLDATKDTSAILQIAFRKTSDFVFRPPLDMWPGMSVPQFKACAEGAMGLYASTGVVSRREVRSSVAELVTSVGGLR